MLELRRRKLYKEGRWGPTGEGKFANRANSRGRAGVRRLTHGTTPPSRDGPRGARARGEATRGGPLNNTLEIASPSIPPPSALDRARLCARIAEENKAKNVLVLDMRSLTPLFDFFVLCTGASRRQIHTIAEEIDAALRAVGDERLSIQGYQASRWIVQDYGDVVVHVFDAESREYYALEDLWADAPHVEWKQD